MKKTFLIIFALSIQWGVCAQSGSKYSLYGGATIGVSNIDDRNPGFGMELGFRFQLRKKWGASIALNSFFSESTGGFKNPEDLPYLVNNAFASNPLLNFHNPDNSPDAFPGLIQFHTTFNRHAIWSASLFGSYAILSKPKQSFSAQMGLSLHSVDLVNTDYFLRGSFDGFIDGTYDAIFPVYRHQRFLDIGPTANFVYTHWISENWWLGGRIGGTYMPKSSTILGAAGILVGVKL
jgi:hypothetical protein